MKPDLIIFDCDGVLVDSEALENQLLVDMAERHGLRVNADEAHLEFVGRKLADCVRHMERVAGRNLPDTFIEDYRKQLKVIVERELKPIAGVREALELIAVLKCVASNGPRNKIEQALRVTGLQKFFEGRLFCAYDVSAWKPEPDLFLHAAKMMGVPPEACTVIEDSRLGVQAALAAGMRVVAYEPTGGVVPGTITIKSMDQLPRMRIPGQKAHRFQRNVPSHYD
jgi:HAD superfamily hydrolase (TIGR01509 family)